MTPDTATITATAMATATADGFGIGRPRGRPRPYVNVHVVVHVVVLVHDAVTAFRLFLPRNLLQLARGACRAEERFAAMALTVRVVAMLTALRNRAAP